MINQHVAAKKTLTLIKKYRNTLSAEENAKFKTPKTLLHCNNLIFKIENLQQMTPK